MHSGCFACDVIIEDDDIDVIVDRFLAHGEEVHGWDFAEEALRNYSRNYAEATVRLTGSTERAPELGEVTVHPVTEDRIDDWLYFFDHLGFAGNPDWASCYCLEPHDPPPDGMERPWRQSREMQINRLHTGGTFGYLAYVDGSPGGWVNASLSSQTVLDSHSTSEGADAESVVLIGCFVIAPPYRRHGLAGILLDRVIADAPARGAAWIEGFPRLGPSEDGDAGYFRGPMDLFQSKGFEPVATREHHTVVRRPV